MDKTKSGLPCGRPPSCRVMKGSAVFFDAVGGEGRILRDGGREADAVPLSKLGAPVEKAFRLRLVLAAGYFIKAVDEDVRDVEVAAVQADTKPFKIESRRCRNPGSRSTARGSPRRT